MTLGVTKMCGCTGLSFSSTGGGGGGGGVVLTIFGGLGGGATGISVIGIAISVVKKLSCVLICCGKTSGMMKIKPTNTICTMALTPTRFMRDSPSGNNARRAGIGLVPIFFFQACGSEAERREESSPTPSRVLLVGGFEIIVVIRVSSPWKILSVTVKSS